MAERLQEERGPNLRDYWRILVEGRWYIILSFVVVVVSTAFFTFTADPVYEASGRILVLTNREKATGEESTLSVPTSLSGDVRNEVPNWIEMMTSRSALEKALAQLRADPQFVELMVSQGERLSLLEKLFGRASQAQGAQHNPTATSASEEAEEPLSIEALKGRISVANVRGTDLIEVKATGGSSLEAKLITNALCSAYLALDTELTKTTLASVKEFLNTQVKKTEDALISAEEQFAQFRQEFGLEMGFDHLEQLVTQLGQLKTEAEVELTEKQADLEVVNSRLERVEQDLLEGEVSLEDSTGGTTVTDQDIAAQLRHLQGEIKDLAGTRVQYLETGDYAQAQEIENRIVAREQTIEQLSQGRFEPFDLLPLHETLVQQQMELYVSIHSLRPRVEALQMRTDQEMEKLATCRLQYQRFERDIQINEDIYTMFREEYERARIADVGELGGIRMVGWAVEPGSPIKPTKKLNLILGALVGMTIGTGFAFLKEYLDNTYKTTKQVEQDLGIPSLGAVYLEGPKRSRKADRVRHIRQHLISKLDAKDPVVNAYIGIEASLRFASVDRPLKTLMVTSAIPEEGKSTLVANLGLVFSHTGRSTVIVDTDLRRPVFHRIFGLDRDVGLTSVALAETDLEQALVRPYVTPSGKAIGRGLAHLLLDDLGRISQDDLEEASRIERREHGRRSLEKILIDEGKLKPEDLEEALAKRSKGLENFHVLPSGPQPLNPTDFLGSKRVKALIEQLKERFEVVLFDSPPVTSVPDATMLSSQVDGTILVISAEDTSRAAVHHAVEQLNKAGANIIGMILNRARRSTARYYGGYYGYYQGYHEDTENKGGE